MQISHNVTFRVIDRGTNKVVREYEGHNMATNSMVLGVGYFLAGNGDLDQNAIYNNFIPKYISLGTMGLINQNEDEDGLPIGIGGKDSTMPDDPSTESDAAKTLRYTAYMDEAPGYGADGYGDNPAVYNNDRSDYGLGPVYSSGVPIKCELISASFPRTKIAYSNVINETNSETTQTIDVVVSAMISTGALAQFRNGADHIFITEAGLWSTNKYSSSGRGLLAGYRIKPPNDANWDMSNAENRKILQENIIRVGINQIVQVVWKIQIGSIARLNMSDGSLGLLTNIISGTATNINIPDTVTQIGAYAFYRQTAISNVVIPNTVTTIGQCAFQGCTLLSNVTIKPGSLTSIGYSAFEGCTNLIIAANPDTVTTLGNYAYANCTFLAFMYLSDNTTTIGDYVFLNCTHLAYIKIPSTTTTIGEHAFENCTNLTDIYIRQPEGSISGAPWGAPNATVHWNYSGQ